MWFSNLIQLDVNLLLFRSNKLVEASPEIEKQLKAELEKVAKQYGGSGEDMTKFPTFKFEDPVIAPINLEK